MHAPPAMKPEPHTSALEIHWRRATAAGAAAVTAPMALLAAALIIPYRGRAGIVAFLAICVASIGWMAACSVGRARETRPVLVFSEAGLADPTGIFGFGELAWSAVVRVRTGRGRRPFQRIRVELEPRAGLEPLSIPRRILLFARSGSTPRSISFSVGAVHVTPGFAEAVRTLAPPTVAIA
jgi:hypothetical protein